MVKKIRNIPNINARDFATILNINPYQTPFQLLEQKIENKYPFFGNKFTEHGNKYEKIALEVYETNTGNKVEIQQKSIKHNNYDWITGRIDGLTLLSNYEEDEQNDIQDIFEQEQNTKKRKRKIVNIKKNKKIKKQNKTCIIEIKCPLKEDRKEPLTIENIPKYYWSQCQVYMHLLDCNIAHYVEFYIKPNDIKENGMCYYIEIKRDDNWWNDNIYKIKLFYEEIKKYHKLGSLDSHPIRIEEKRWEQIFC
jgi:putative phage-type endonuclease